MSLHLDLEYEVVGLESAVGNALQSARVIAIVGSRRFPEMERVKALIRLLDPRVLIISGGAKGVDAHASYAAAQLDHPVVDMVPGGVAKHNWVAAAHHRNLLLVKNSELVVAFWDGSSTGTLDTISKALEHHGQLVVVLPGQPPNVWSKRS